MTFRRARPCPICGKPVALSKDGRIRWHRDTRPKPGGAPDNPACAGVNRLPDEQPGAARAMADTGTEPTPAPSIHAGMSISETLRAFDQRITELRDFIGPALQQLQQTIIQAAIACATCLAEERQQARPGHNIANAIIDGTGYCNEHLDVHGARLVPRKSSGLIVTGG